MGNDDVCVVTTAEPSKTSSITTEVSAVKAAPAPVAVYVAINLKTLRPGIIESLKNTILTT